MTVVVPDLLGDLRSWCRTHPDLSSLHGGRVFFRLPNQRLTYPLVRVYRAGGGMTSAGGDAPVLTTRIAWDCWGHPLPEVDSSYLGAPGSFADLSHLVAALESSLWQVGPQLVGAATQLLSAEATNVLFSPDDTGQPRFVVDSQVVCRLHTARDLA